jgi:hypothetical protein
MENLYYVDVGKSITCAATLLCFALLGQNAGWPWVKFR